nr:MAG TPA: hypothetical protein [Caudoviricetes sp.]
MELNTKEELITFLESLKNDVETIKASTRQETQEETQEEKKKKQLNKSQKMKSRNFWRKNKHGFNEITLSIRKA